MAGSGAGTGKIQEKSVSESKELFKRWKEKDMSQIENHTEGTSNGQSWNNLNSKLNHNGIILKPNYKVSIHESMI